jgi:hypothetical protein
MYLLSTCGSTEPSEKMYTSYFEDEFGNIACKEIPHPRIAQLLYDYLPLIDEHNKQQKSILGLERKWPTRKCWFRLLRTLVGMCIVDMHHLYRNLRPSDYQEMDILQFSDIICKKLKPQNWRLPQRLKPGEALERISNNDGDTRYKLTNRQYNKGHNAGKCIQQNCFMCWKYLKRNGNTLCNQTSFRCSLCKMLMCKKDRTDLCTGRLTSYLKEHQESNCKVVGCFGSDRTYTVFPRKLQLNLLRRGTTLNAGTGRGRWDLVDSNFNDEVESSGEDSEEDDSEEDGSTEEDGSKEDGSEESSIRATPTERVHNEASSSRRNTKTSSTKKSNQHRPLKKEKLILLLNRGVRKEVDPAQRNLQGFAWAKQCQHYY